jgi:hypothetical protein
MKKIINYLIILLFAYFIVSCAKAPEKKVKVTPRLARVEHRITIPGTWPYDVDAMRFGGSLERYRFLIEHVNKKIRVDYKTLEFGANRDECDIFWQQIDRTRRRLVPWNGAELAILGMVNFDDVTLEDLLSARYSKDKIVGDDNNNQLIVGTIIGVRTNKGNYAKMRVDGYIPLIRNLEKVENYNLQCTLVVYVVPKSNKWECKENCVNLLE